ncbi:MAG: hypothetical protein LBV31_02740 [Prevotellaceae bacterium]|nr:hypothetical protein [Prevotellaceae bacterium]
MKKNITYNLLVFSLLCAVSIVFAQSPPQKGQLGKDVMQQQKNAAVAAPPAKRPAAAPKSMVEIIHSDFVIGDEENLPGVQVLKGNVQFKHDNALMYCDSAYFYQADNSLDAFNNVRIIQADTLFVYGDYLFYNGNTRLAELRENVRMVNRRAVLTTDSLNYDRNTNIAYYFTGGKIKDDKNTLTSVWGQYSTATSVAIFRKNVHLTNPSFVMTSDTLHYNTKTHIADIVGQTHIKHQKETDIYSTKGWYNTENERSMLLNRSLVVNQSGKTLTGDTVFYDKKQNYGEGFQNVELTDTAQGTTLSGDYVFYNELTDYGFATDSALLIYWKETENAYIHADTLQTLKDSIFNVALGFHNVRMYRSDIQGIADSLAYSARDSVINFYGLPVVWSQGSQMSGEQIRIFTKNQQADSVRILKNAMISQATDSAQYFNQISGKEIIAQLDSGQLKHVRVNGNAESVFYPVDDSDSTIIFMNKTKSSFIDMYFVNKKIYKIKTTTKTDANGYPLEQLSDDQLYLRNFFWLEEQQPKNPIDVFTYYADKERVMPSVAPSTKGVASDTKGVAPSKKGETRKSAVPNLSSETYK